MCQFSRFYLQNPIKKFRDKTMLVVSFLNKFGCCLTELLAQNNIYLFLKRPKYCYFRIKSHLLIWLIGLFLPKNIFPSSGSNSGKKLHIQWSILPHPVVCTSTSGGQYSHIHGLYSHIRRSVLPHPVVYICAFQQSIQALIV